MYCNIMIIPDYIPDDIHDYIYSLIVYKHDEYLLKDIRHYHSCMETIKMIEDNLIINKLLEYNYIDFTVPKPILSLYKTQHKKNKKLLINLCFAKKNINERNKVLEKIFTTCLYNILQLEYY
jgi:hypothetical protein